MDRCESYNGCGGPLASEIPAALFGNGIMIRTVSYIYGLAGRDFTVDMARGIFEDLHDMTVNGKTLKQHTYVGLRTRTAE